MNIINDFLKNPIIPEVKEDIIVSDKELASINDLFASNDVPVNYLHLRPKIKENQIWTIKRSYMDYEGILPFLIFCPKLKQYFARKKYLPLHY